MARGFLSGVLWGGVVGVGVSGAASVIGPIPVGPQVAAVAPDVTQAPARVEDTSSGNASSTADSAPVTGSDAPQAPAPAPDTAVALDADTLTSPAQEQMPAPSALATLDVDTAPADITANDEAAVIPTPQALAPMAPQEPDDVAIDTAPADPPVTPQAEPDRVADETVVAQDAAPEVPVEAAPEVGLETIQPDTAPAAAEAEAVTAQTVEQTTTDAEARLEPVTPPSRVTDALGTQSTQTAENQESVESQETTETPDQTETTVSGGNARPRIGTQVGSLVDRDTGVTIRRPSSASLGEVDEAEAQEVAAEGPSAGAPDARPIRRFAANYTPDGDKPLMSIVLIDDGSSPVTGAAGLAALRGFPYPLSFAVDTTLSDAVERMGLYRKEGFEVLAMVDLPEGALPADAETAFGVVLSQMDQVVGVLEGPAGGLQGSREVADQVTSILLQTGHGLLAQDKGLNTMPKLARKEGVPADPVFRDFDSKGQTASVIRRFLDQAAFKAGQEGAVVMLGRLRPDTVSALLLWGLQDRAGKVALVPISAVLLREE